MYCSFERAMRIVNDGVRGLIEETYPNISQPELDLITSIAVSDFLHYLAFRLGMYDKASYDGNIIRTAVCRYVTYNSTKAFSLLRKWFRLWLIKWRQRVRLIFNEEEFKRLSSSSTPSSAVAELMSRLKLEELKLLSISMLIRIGEVAGLEPIAENIIREELSALSERKKVDEIIEMYRSGELTSRIISRTVGIRGTQSPLIILRVDLGAIST